MCRFSVEDYFRNEINMTDSETEVTGIFGLLEGIYYTGLVEGLRDYCDHNGTFFEIPGGIDRIAKNIIEKRLRETKIVYNSAVTQIDQAQCRKGGRTGCKVGL